MESYSNDTEQQLLSNLEVIPPSPTVEGPQMELDESSGTFDGRSGETVSDGANVEARASSDNESGGQDATGGPPGDDGPSSQDLEQLQVGRPKNSFWVCCGGGISAGCPNHGVWLVVNTPACLDCEHRICYRCESKEG
ncbi:hypothetical protein HOY80DRAFT_922355 [Tuber brumale]|nr:hypothetical protein HOY80DRAFT_922355 [Tuber brumale]